MINRARSFFELISSASFRKTGKQDDTLYNRLKSQLQTDNEEILAAYISNSRISLRELDFDVRSSNLGAEAKKRYLELIQRFSQFFSLNRPFTQMKDSQLPEYETGFLYLSEQKDVFSLAIDTGKMQELTNRVSEASDLLLAFPFEDSRVRKIEQSLNAISHFLRQADSQSFDACWSELSGLVLFLYREQEVEGDPEKRKLLKRLGAWGAITVAALAGTVSVIENAEKLVGFAAEVLQISQTEDEG